MGVTYLSVDEAVTLVTDMGFQVGRFDLFASAIVRPQMSVGGQDAYPSLYRKAAALMESVAWNHGLVDGNKRSSWVLTRVFLLDNGRHIDVTTREEFDHVLAVAQGQKTVEDAARWLHERCVRDRPSQPA